MRGILAALAAALLILGTHAVAQVSFDVASVKENTETAGPSGLRRAPDGALRAERMRARFLITIAYGLQPFQLVSAPAWTNDAYYDINAKPARRIHASAPSAQSS